VAGAATATEADAAASSAEEDAESRFEEDLELTRSVILRHIERMAADDDDDDDEGNDRIIVDDEDDDDDDNEDEHNIEMRDFDKLRKTPLRDYYDDNATGGRSRVGSTKTTAMRGGGGEEEDDDDSIIDVAVVDVENDVEREIAKGQSSSSSSSSSTSSSIDDADASANAVAAPTIPRILRYTLPAIGIWLCSPVLSMIDTAAVGMLAGTAQQAALNPAISVSDYGALVVAFMYTATTNLVAAAAREDRDDAAAASAAASSSASTTTATGGARTTTKTTTTNDDAGVRRSTPHRPRTTRTLVTALRLATGVGTFFAIALFALGPRLLKLLIGNDASHLDPVVFDSALRYVRIRALGMPAMVTIGTAQSACLGMQDVRSPLYVLLAAAIVNFLGDVALVPLSGGWRGDFFGGAAGAAWATVASQYAALLFFARWWLTEPPGAAIGDNCDAAAPANAAAGWKANLRLFLKKKDGGGEGDGAGTTETSATSSGGGGGGHLETDGLLPAAMTIVTTTTATGALASDNANENRIIRWISNDRRKRRHHHRDPTAPSPTETMAQRRRRGPGKNTTTATTTRGFLSDSGLTLRSYLSPKNLDASKAWEFLPFVVPVTTTSVGRISGYIAMSHVASSTLGTIDMAGHQIILSIFSCITPFVDALSQVAQSLVPEVYAANGEGKRRNGRRERSIALGRTVQNFRKVGAGLGAVLVGLVSCIPLISRYFTTDAYVLASVHGAIPPVGLFMLVNGLMCAGEGERSGVGDWL
jgi:Na+-driven multidrug efflux pump